MTTLALGATVTVDMDIRREIESWVQQWRAAMLRFARLHLSSLADAEDAVQDTFAAVLLVEASTLSGVEPRRYLFGILRNKVMDRLRSRYRHDREFAQPFADDLDALLFDSSDHWLSGVAPALWHSPEADLLNEAFFKVVDICVNHLPAKPARVFSMKELLECDPEEICHTLGISKADYWQCISRVRKQIHLCLNERWFGGKVL